MKFQFGSRWRRLPSETRRGAGAIRQTASVLLFLRLVLLPPLLLQELRTCDPKGARLQPLVLDKKAPLALCGTHDSSLFRLRSTPSSQLCHRRCCAPNRGKCSLQATTLQNSDACTLQSNPMSSVPPL